MFAQQEYKPTYPQLSAVIECADAAHGLGAHVIADGGVRVLEMCKRIWRWCRFCYAWWYVSGHDEGNGKLVKVNGSKYISFMDLVQRLQIKTLWWTIRLPTAEERLVKYRGKINDTILNILGGVRSSCTYVGAPSLKQLSKCTTFVRVSNQFNETFLK